MKKRTLWPSAVIMGIALLALLCLQTLYFNEVIDICAEQFDVQVQRSLRKVARETQATLSLMPSFSEMTIEERTDGLTLDRELRKYLEDNGLSTSYHFTVCTTDGRIIYACPDYEEPGRTKVYTQELFQQSPMAQMGLLKVHFPNRKKVILESIHYMVPVLVVILLVLVLFVFIFSESIRQRRLAEEKNDFINNMTHELKTPVSTISLAAQMLADPSMPKTEATLNRLSGVITDEAKRLRFLVDKVLQASLFDHSKTISFKLKATNAHTLITEVVDVFRIKVEKHGGKLTALLEAPECTVLADEMHLTNVVFNLLDNAVKYRSADRPLRISISTKCDSRHLIIRIEDNGVGISTDNLKRIFEKFYRVSTGNRHDVKGFGLGLAYVRSVVRTLGGTIHVESPEQQGTAFIIRLPLNKE